MAPPCFDFLSRRLAQPTGQAHCRRSLLALLVSSVVAQLESPPIASKAKKHKKKPKPKGCPRGQQKDPYGICGVYPKDCLVVGALCGTFGGQSCCSDQCVLTDSGEYRCLPGTARCRFDFDCVAGYTCRGYRCLPD